MTKILKQGLLDTEFFFFFLTLLFDVIFKPNWTKQVLHFY